MERNLNHCGECVEYPCKVFKEREGLSFDEAAKRVGDDFNVDEYNELLSAYDNKTRLGKYKNSQTKWNDGESIISVCPKVWNFEPIFESIKRYIWSGWPE